MRTFDHDLQQVPPPYQKPLRRYLFHGVIPCDQPDLVALLVGDRSPLHSGNGDAALVIVGAFLESHDEIDIAHGHCGLVLRWQYLGGLAGRNAQ